MSEILPKGLGAVTFIPQAPADGGALAVEIWAAAPRNNANENRASYVYHTVLVGRTVVFDSEGIRWLFTADNRPDFFPVGAYARSCSAFERLGEQIVNNQFPLQNILRTWIYQGLLLLSEGDSQRYKELNRARTVFFRGLDFLADFLPSSNAPQSNAPARNVYPASTGIGTDDVDVTITAVALDSGRRDFFVTPLENPQQTSAFDYTTVYSPQSPKFARAMAVVTNTDCCVFVSGTASILAAESQHRGDAAAQTELTLDNINALLGHQNLVNHGIQGVLGGLGGMKCVRVYVKNSTDYPLIRGICERRLGNIPILYTIADVCRPELLVEIEGVAHWKR